MVSTKHTVMTPRWIHFTFCAIWLGTAIVFATLARDSYENSNTKLERYSKSFPRNSNVIIGGSLDIAKTMEEMADANNRNVNRLEASIHNSGVLAMWLNIVSFLMAVFGLLAQLGAYIHELRKDKNEARREQSG
jgi:hypothetical protein